DAAVRRRPHALPCLPELRRGPALFTDRSRREWARRTPDLELPRMQPLGHGIVPPAPPGGETQKRLEALYTGLPPNSPERSRPLALGASFLCAPLVAVRRDSESLFSVCLTLDIFQTLV